MMAGSLQTYNRVFDLVEPKLPVKYPRDLDSICRAEREGNPFNAWVYRTDIRGSGDGKLQGKRVAIKDNVQVAGVPMTNGSELVRGFVPTEDATIVTRILDAGGRIVGTTNCEDMCLSGASFTCINGPVLNPCDVTRVAGGSSSGSAVVVGLRWPYSFIVSLTSTMQSLFSGGGWRGRLGDRRGSGWLHSNACWLLRDCG